MAGKKSNIRIGEFYSINRFVEMIEKSSIGDKKLLCHTDRNSEFGFFYGEENRDKGNGNKGNPILLGTAQTGTELVKCNFDRINNKEQRNKRMKDIIRCITNLGISLTEFKAVLDEFFDVSFMAASARDALRDDKTLKYRVKLEERRQDVCNEMANINGVEYEMHDLEQYCNNKEMSLPENISVQSLQNWKEELQTRIDRQKAEEPTIENNNRIRVLRRKRKEIDKILEKKDTQTTDSWIKEKFPDVLSLNETLQVKVTGFQYFDMICHQDAVYDVTAIEIDRDTYQEYFFGQVICWGDILEQDICGVEEYFRTMVEKQDRYVLQNPDYIDVKNVRDFVNRNEDLILEVDLRKSREKENFCVICVRKRDSGRKMLQGTDLYKKAGNYVGPYRQEYEKMSKEKIDRAIASACLCIASCSGVSDVVGKLFDGILLQIVSLFSAKDYTSVKNLLIQCGWKFGMDKEEDSKRACVLYIYAKLLNDFTDEEKRRLGLTGKSEIDLCEEFYDLHRKYLEKNSREVQEFKLSSCWSMFIGNCCLTLARRENNNVVSDKKKIKEYIKLAENDEMSKKEAYLLHGELCSEGIVYKKDDIKAFDYFLKSELNAGMSNAVAIMNDMKKNGRYEDFVKCWKRQYTEYSDPVEKLYERYNGANADLYDLFVRQNVEEEYHRADKDVLLLAEKLGKYLKDCNSNNLGESLNIPKHQIVLFGKNAKTETYLSSFGGSDNTEIYLIDENITDEEFMTLQGRVQSLKGFKKSVELLIVEGKLAVFEIESICKSLYSPSIVTRKLVDNNKLHFLFLNDDKNENLENAIRIFELAKDYQRKYDALFCRIDQEFKSPAYNLTDSFRLSEYVELTIEVDSNDMELYMDNLQKQTQGFYLPVRYLNYEEEIAKDLLIRKPLFLPLLNSNRKTDAKLSIAVLGNDKSIISLMKMIVSVGCFGTESILKNTSKSNLVNAIYSNKIKLILISGYADEIMDELKYEAPALYSGVDYGLCSIESYAVDVKSSNFIRLFGKSKMEQIEKKDNTLLKLAEQIPDIDYYICAMDEDKDSAKLAQKIRELLYSASTEYKYRPIIAALCRDTKYARRNEVISVGNKVIKGLWHTDYQVYFYGMSGNIYSRNNLDNNEIQKLALKIHCSYSDKGWKAEDKAKNSYYCNAYNRDSSIMAALYSIYRCYSAGLYKKGHDWNEKDIWDNFNLGDLNVKLNEQQILGLAVQEHIRWCGQMIVRSWRPVVGREQMENYLKEGVKNHQLFVGKIHPYLARWDRLGDRGCVGDSDGFSDVVERFNECTEMIDRYERVSLIYFLRNVLRPYCKDMMEYAAGEYTTETIEHKADIHEEIEETLKGLNEAAEKVEQFEQNCMNEDEKRVYQDIESINEKFRIWIEKCKEVIAEHTKEDYLYQPVSFYQKMKLFIPELQKSVMDIERVLVSSDYQEEIYRSNECFRLVNQWLISGEMANHTVNNVVQKITEEYISILYAFMNFCSEESGDGIQLWTDSLLWKYLPDKISKLSIKETNIEMVNASLELYREMMRSELDRNEYIR